jgi:hypothetical protein
MFLCGGFLSLRILFSRFTHVGTTLVQVPVLHFKNKTHMKYKPYFIYSFSSWLICWFCFHFGAIMNNNAVNIHVQVFAWKYVFACPGLYM